jgi:hypothetical protein
MGDQREYRSLVPGEFCLEKKNIKKMEGKERERGIGREVPPPKKYPPHLTSPRHTSV